MSPTTTDAELEIKAAAARSAVQSLASAGGVEIDMTGTAGADQGAAALTTAVLLMATGPAGSVLVGMSEGIAEALVAGAGVSSDDPEASWQHLGDVAMTGASTFVSELSQAGALVGPVDSIIPTDHATAVGAGDWVGVECTATVGGVAGSIFLMLATSPAAPASAPGGQAQNSSVGDVRYPELGDGAMSAAGRSEMALLSDVSMDVTVELGRTTMLVRDVLALTEGSVVELNRPVGAHVDVLVNGSNVARGEVVVIDDVLGVRITSVSAEGS